MSEDQQEMKHSELVVTLEKEHTSENEALTEQLFRAVESNDLETIERLLAGDEDNKLLYARDNEDYTVLHRNAMNGNEEITKLLLNKDTNNKLVHMTDSKERAKKIRRYKNGGLEVKGSIPIHWALENGHLGVAVLLLKADPDSLYEVDNDGNTTLHLAVSKYDDTSPVKGSKVDLAEWIIKNDKKSKLLHRANSHGWTPVFTAVASGDIQSVDFLIEKGASKIGEKDLTLFHAAALSPHETDNAAIFDHLNIKYNEGDLLNKTNEDDFTALDYAAAVGNQTFVTKVIDINPDLLYRTDKLNWSAIYYATAYGKPQIVKLLLNADKDRGFPNSSDKDGWTLLIIAIKYEMLEVIKILLPLSELRAHDNKGKTALHVAAESDQPEIVKLLLHMKNGKQLLHMRDNDGNTALDLAVKNQHPETIFSLVKRLKAHSSPEQYERQIKKSLENNRIVPVTAASVEIGNILRKPATHKRLIDERNELIREKGKLPDQLMDLISDFAGTMFPPKHDERNKGYVFDKDSVLQEFTKAKP